MRRQEAFGKGLNARDVAPPESGLLASAAAD
jgi:hypothetical protein